MQISVLQENLQQVIQDIQKSLPTRPSLPILSCVLLTAEESGLISLSVTDLNVGIRSAFKGDVKTPGKVAIPAKTFIDYVGSIGAGTISFSLEGTTLTLKTKDSQATLQCFSAADYPDFPEKEGTQLTLPFSHFATAVQATSFAASLDETRPILTSLLFSFDESLEVVGTDGFRLATVSLDHSAPPLRLLLPARAVSEVVRIATRKKVEEVSFTVSEKLKQIFFSFGDVEMLVRLMDGDFPPYQKIIPPDYSLQVVFNAAEFGQKLKTAMVFARESSGIIRFKIGQDTLTIISASSALGTQETTLPVRVLQGQEGEIAFNAKYLVDFLNVLKPEEVWFGMNESLKPALFRPAGMENYRYVVMPFRVTQA